MDEYGQGGAALGIIIEAMPRKINPIQMEPPMQETRLPSAFVHPCPNAPSVFPTAPLPSSAFILLPQITTVGADALPRGVNAFSFRLSSS